MTEPRKFLARAVGSFEPDPDEAYADTTRLGERQRRFHHLVAAISALAVAGAIFGGLWAVYRPGSEVRPVQPVPGPTPTQGLPPFGRANCEKSPWFSAPMCTGRSGPVVLLGRGTHGDAPWTLTGYRAVYEGPRPGERPDSDPPTEVRPAVCLELDYRGTEGPICEMALSEDGTFGFELDESRQQYDRPLPPDPGDDPLEGIKGSSLGRSLKTENIVWGWMPEGTSWVRATLDDGRKAPTFLGSSGTEALGTSSTWWVAFLPVDARSVTFIAIDEHGDVVWLHSDDILQRMVVEKRGNGDGTVEGYWTYELESPGPHRPRPEVNCGADCWYAFMPGRGDTDFTLIVEPAPGSRFSGWHGPCEGQPETCEIPMRETQTVTAIFESVG